MKLDHSLRRKKVLKSDLISDSRSLRRELVGRANKSAFVGLGDRDEQRLTSCENASTHSAATSSSSPPLTAMVSSVSPSSFITASAAGGFFLVFLADFLGVAASSLSSAVSAFLRLPPAPLDEVVFGVLAAGDAAGVVVPLPLRRFSDSFLSL